MELSKALPSLLSTFKDRAHYLKAKHARVKQTPNGLRVLSHREKILT